MELTNNLETAEELIDHTERVKSLYGDKWEEIYQKLSTIIEWIMEMDNEINPLRVVVKNKHKYTENSLPLMFAVAVEMICVNEKVREQIVK